MEKNNKMSKENLEDAIKKIRSKMGLSIGILYASVAGTVYVAGDSIYKFAVGDYKNSIMEASLSFLLSYIVYDKYRTIEKKRDDMKEYQNELEKLVKENERRKE